MDQKLTCQMSRECSEPVNRIDEKGYVYCDFHGQRRKYTIRCRKLTPKETRTLESGQPIKYYRER